ncbi:MAG TPA: pyruvate formate lyase-activating protein [Candidatus Acutalibacter stercorigallinarum]|nr:pyruvate formate lyase-activating protein [Candidatus Acutalibacter stercorigallinarum]
MEGWVHSLQSLGTVDGPGLRYVVFLQGCPLRCVYCHNPDTWDPAGGAVMDTEELVEKILRCRPYFGAEGGVTVSGGEPLLQAEFVTQLFARLKREGVHTALDTSGAGDLGKAPALLEVTDLVLLDLKFPTEEGYRQYCRGSLGQTEAFAALVAEKQVPLWVRHVVAPGLNDTLEDMAAVKSWAQRQPTLEKIEWLPFHNLCLEKYQQLGVPFPLADTPPMDREKLDRLIAALG